MKDKAKAGDLKVVQTAQQKVPEKKKRRWDQPTSGDEPAKEGFFLGSGRSWYTITGIVL